MRVLIFIFSIIILIFVVSVIMYLFFSFSKTIPTHEMTRIGKEISDILLSSPLSEKKGIFKVEMLEKYSENSITPYKKEPYARQCKYGYRIEIEDLINDNVWKFGYQPIKGLEIPEITHAISLEYNIHVIYENGEIHPAKMSIHVFHDYFTELTCLVEKAWTTKKVHKMYTTCIRLNIKNYDMCGIPVISQNSPGSLVLDSICIVNPKYPLEEPFLCRYMPTAPDLKLFNQAYKPKDDRLRVIKAIPISKTKLQNINIQPPYNSNNLCLSSILNKIKITDVNEDIAFIILCYGELE